MWKYKKNYLTVRFLSLFFFLFLSDFMIHAASLAEGKKDDYASLWKKVEVYDKQSLPRSALKEVSVIADKARQEKNSPQWIRALLEEIKYKEAIDPSDFLPSILNLEKETRQAADKNEQAVLSALLSRLYLQYYNENAYKIDRRTALVGSAPNDPAEWSTNLFMKKIDEYATLSLHDKDLTAKTNIAAYRDLLNPKAGDPDTKNTLFLTRTLYDFLLRRAIDTYQSLAEINRRKPFFKQTELTDTTYFESPENFLQAKISSDPFDFTLKTLSAYQDLFSLYRSPEDLRSRIVTELSFLQFLRTNIVAEDKDRLYIQTLENMEKQYGDRPESVEIIHEIAQYYNQYTPSPDAESSESNDMPPTVSPRSADDMKKAADISLQYKKKAYVLCREGIRRFPSYDRIGLLKDFLSDMTRSFLDVNQSERSYPSDSLNFRLNYRNLDGITYRIYRSDLSPRQISPIKNADEAAFLKTANLYKTGHISLADTYSFMTSDTLIRIPVDRYGIYLLQLSKAEPKGNIPDSQELRKIFFVSRLAIFSRSYGKKNEVLTVDRESGTPIEGAKINVYNQKTKAFSQYVSDSNGLVRFDADPDRQTSLFAQAEWKEDRFMPFSSINTLSYFPETSVLSSKHDRVVNLFADRSIYRPGQEVRFKAIAGIRKDSTSSFSVETGKTYTVRLSDANRKEIASKAFTTNDFGSFSGSFVLPSAALNGMYSLSAGDRILSFRVEAYKRPRFYFILDSLKTAWCRGDTIPFSGSLLAYSGAKMPGSIVSYTVKYSGSLIRSDTIVCDAQGRFRSYFLSRKRSFPQDISPWMRFDSYQVELRATDGSGETQVENFTVPMLSQTYLLQFPGFGDQNKDSIFQKKINVSNAAGIPQRVKVNYSIYSLSAPKNPRETFDDRDFKIEKELIKGSVFSDDDLDLMSMKSFPSGRYKLVVQAVDPKGRISKGEQFFNLYSYEDKKPPIPLYRWILTKNEQYDYGDKAVIVYGSAAKNVSVLYEIFKADSLLSRSRFMLNNENRKLVVPFLPSYGEGVRLNLSFVKEGKIYFDAVDLQRKQVDRRLRLHLDVFRDKLLPGEKEEWKISVRDAKNLPIKSEILAGMYDASLDAIYPHSWYFNPGPVVPVPYSYSIGWLTPYYFFDSLNRPLSGILKESNYPSLSYYSFRFPSEDSFIVGEHFRMSSALGGRLSGVSNSESTYRLRAASKSIILTDQVMAAGNAVLNETRVVGKSEAKSPATLASAETFSPKVSIRSDFDETAFFYPELRTNDKGETILSFKVPDSNTHWKFMALAHTKDMRYGEIIKEAVSQKKLMVSPDLPRFLRQGDEASLSISVQNLSDEAQSGTAVLTFFDPATDRPIEGLNLPNIPFSVDKNGNIPLSWHFKVPSGINLIAFKVYAKTTDFSDGEQHLLPVLPDSMFLTESLPLYLNGGDKRTFSLQSLHASGRAFLPSSRLSLEFASDPVWYAVQALPGLSTPVADNAVSSFAALYSALLSSRIVQNSPAVQNALRVWQQQSGSGNENLLSSLEKNQDLKNVLLNETPWVTQAESETERKQTLASLFDTNKIDDRIGQFLGKLEDLQLPGGGWAWYKGMQASPDLTQWILTGFGRLKNSDPDLNDRIKELYKKAVLYSDGRFADYFKKIPKAKQKNPLDAYELSYLYMRSFYPELPISASASSASDFLLQTLRKNWNSLDGMEEKAMASLILERNGNQDESAKLINSLREYAKQDATNGMYWPSAQNGNSFSRSSLALETLMMEAFSENGASVSEIDAMKTWLLRQKQTEMWESVPSTVDAVQAIIGKGTDWLKKGDDFQIKWGNRTIKPDPSDIPGYLRKNFSGSEMDHSMMNIEISKSGSGPAWGAVYLQYPSKLKEISSAASGLQIDKKLYVERLGNAGKVLVPIVEGVNLKIGERVIVRLTVRTDRDYEFVSLKDLRAACFEPGSLLSGMQWNAGASYYQTTGDAATSFFFDRLSRGVYVFEYPLFVERSGQYSDGTATLQCLYAPEFVAHSAGGDIKVE